MSRGRGRSPPCERRPVLTFTEILIDALLRATFVHDLSWRSPGDGFLVTSLPGTDRISDAFRFGDDGPWLEIEARAAASADATPQIAVRVAVPAPGLREDEGLRAANDANRQGLASVFFDAPAELLVVQQSIVFTGYHAEPDASITFAQREATVNLVAAVLATAGYAAKAGCSRASRCR